MLTWFIFAGPVTYALITYLLSLLTNKVMPFESCKKSSMYMHKTLLADPVTYIE